MDKTKELFDLARRYLAGGVSSPARSFKYAGCHPLVAKSAFGAKIFDFNKKSFLDYSLSFGALILGHSHPDVVRVLRKKAGEGFNFGVTNKTEIQLAQKIVGALPFIEKIRFVNSGTEAVMGALRLARGYTKKDKILKFRHSYHGHADYLLAESGSGLATFGIPVSLGVPNNFLEHTLIASYGNIENVKAVFEKYKREIAAVIVEPAGGNYGVMPADEKFLAFLRETTLKSGSLLIFDEVITAFRFHYGSLSQVLGVCPDIICLGKIIGGGLPVGAFGAKKEIMDCLAPLGKVYQASTFAGNPLVMQAGLSTLEILEKLQKGYRRLEKLAEILTIGLQEEASSRKIKLAISRYKNMFSLKFAKKEHFRIFYRLMLKGGVYFAPSEFEANFLSFAHTQRDIEKTVALARESLEKISIVH